LNGKFPPGPIQFAPPDWAAEDAARGEEEEDEEELLDALASSAAAETTAKQEEEASKKRTTIAPRPETGDDSILTDIGDLGLVRQRKSQRI
jgi:hypothetical protein